MTILWRHCLSAQRWSPFTTKLYIQRWHNTLTLSDISADRALHNLLEKPYVIFWKAIIFKILFVWKQGLKMGFSKHILLLQQHQFKSNNSGTYSFSHLSLLSNTPSSKVPPRSISLWIVSGIIFFPKYHNLNWQLLFWSYFRQSLHIKNKT